MRDGELFQQPIPALHTSENAAGFWPTPKKALNMEPCGPRVIEAIRTGVSYRANGTMPEACLARIIWTLYHPERPKGKVNPVFVSWLMGWPISWTSLRPLATGKFRQWLRSHGASSPQDFQLEVTTPKRQPVGSKETGGPRDAPARARDPARM
jgi:hypothetical protein